MDARPILICYDSSAGARRAIQAAADLLGARHAVVLDVAPVLTGAESAAAIASPLGTSAFDELNTANAVQRATEGAELARAAGFDAEPRGVVGEPTWEGILAVAEEVDAAVIVMGSRGLNWLRERLEGSRSHEVAQHSSRPVLVVPPPAEPH